MGLPKGEALTAAHGGAVAEPTGVVSGAAGRAVAVLVAAALFGGELSVVWPSVERLGLGVAQLS